MRAKAIIALGELKENAKTCLNDLQKLTKDPNENVRLSLVTALSEIKCQESLSLLQELLHDKSESVRKEAKKAIHARKTNNDNKFSLQEYSSLD